MILKNHGIHGHHWVSFKLAGTKSNRLAIGARLTMKADGITQTEEIHSGASYLSQNDFRVHFGLGSATEIEALEIRWPSRAVDTVKELPVDKFYAVLEGKGIVLPSKSCHWRKRDLICESGAQSMTRGRASSDFGMEQ